MGCDGGTIPKRDELVRKKQKEEKVSKEDDRKTKWRHCAMSQTPLQKPIVACETGRIFNKETIINFLLEKKSSAPAAVESKFDYIRNLKDVKELKLTRNPAYTEEGDKHGQSEKAAEYICPIAGLEMRGSYKFVFLRKCGCVFSERGLKEIKDGICVGCNEKYDEEEIITLNPSEEESVELERKMMERREKEKNQKLKRKKPAESATLTSEATNGEGVDPDESQKLKKIKVDSSAGCSAETLPCSSGTSKLRKSASSAPQTVSGKVKEKKPKTIQDDPNASEVYKSIFNTHHTAKNQTKAHWVTCNPQYY